MANPNAYLRSSPTRQFAQPRPLTIVRANAPAPNLPTFTAAYVGGRVVITFSRAVLASDPLRDPTQYTVTPPAGSPAVTVAGVMLTPTAASLSISGDVRGGGTYLVALPKNLARAVDTGEGNAAASALFTITPVPLAVLSAVPLSPTTLRVTFTKPVKQVSSGNANDALNPANYAITSVAGPLAVTSVAAVAGDTVDLTTAAESPLQYTLIVSNVQDLAGNTI